LTGQRLRHSWPHLFGRHRSSTTTAIRLERPDILLLNPDTIRGSARSSWKIRKLALRFIDGFDPCVWWEMVDR
jgi:hypothetical protein